METAQDYMRDLAWCISEQRDDFERIRQMQLTYDNRINPDTWPTDAQIPTAQHFVAVEEALGPAMDMCFPESNGVQLVPDEPDIAVENLQRTEWALWTMINYRMDLRNAAFRSLKDCFKCSIGYGIVEPFTHTPSVSVVVSSGGKRTRMVVDGRPQISIRYRYVSPGAVVPYPEGSDFDGHDATPRYYFYDPYPLADIEALFQDDGLIEKGELLGTMEDVRKAAQGFDTSGSVEIRELKAALGGRRKSHIQRHPLDKEITTVPVIKVFEQPGDETWIVPGGNNTGHILLKRRSDGVAKVRSGLVKWSAWPDGDRWFPMSQPEADQARSVAYDQWLNFFFDMMTRTRNNRMVIDKSALDPAQRTIDPDGDIYLQRGNAQQAVQRIEPVRIDPSFPVVGDILDRVGNRIRGTQDFMQKNYTRGGTGAFNDLLNTMQARQRLSAMILETGALQRVYEYTLSYMRDLVPDEGYQLTRPTYSTDERRTVLEKQAISSEDLRHGYKVVLDTSERRMLGGMADQTRFEYWKALVDRPDVHKDEVNRVFPLPDSVIRRVFMGREALDEMQAQDRELEMLAQLQQGAPAGPQAPPPEAGMEAGMEGIL